MQQLSLELKSGAEVSRVKTSRLRELGFETGLRGSRLDSFIRSLSSLAKLSPNYHPRKRSGPTIFPRRKRFRNHSPNAGLVRVCCGMAHA